MSEIPENPEPPREEVSPGIAKPTYNYGAKAIDAVLGNPDFSNIYPSSTDVERKYSLAYALVHDGRVQNPTFLLDGLVPTQAVLAQSSIDEEQKVDAVEKGSLLRESLTNLMVEKGLIQPPQWTTKKATQEAGRYITHNQRLKDFVSFFGASNATDILYKLHPQFRGVPQDRVKGMIAEYLGDFMLQSGPLVIGEVKEALPFLSEPNLRQGLTEVWKRDVLHKVSDERHVKEVSDERGMLDSVFEQYREQAAGIEDPTFQEVFEEVREYYSSIFDIPKPANMVDSLNGGRPFPDMNQRINIKEIEEKRRLLIADEMGLGKTASAILAKETLGVKNALVVVPSNVISVWQNFLSDRVNDQGKPIGYFKEGQAPRVLTVEDIGQLEGISPDDFDYILLSQERLNDSHMASLQNLDMGMLIVDEFHKLKNLREGVRAGHLVDLAEKMEGENKYVALLSGTPIPNKVEDIAIALKLLYPDQFENVDNGTLVKSIIQGDIVDIRNLLLPRMQAKVLAESLPMPELTELVRDYQLEGVEKDIYEELLNDDELSSTEKLQILRQFLLNPDMVDPTPGLIGKKIEILDQHLNTQLQTKDKVVVFVNDYTNGVIRGEKNILAKLHIPEGVQVEIIDGPVSQEERQRIQQQMRESDGKMLVFVSGQTADVGVDFSSSEVLDFYNEPWSNFLKKQELGRGYRPGLKNPMTSTTFIGAGTIEEGIHRYTAAKERAIVKLLKGIPTTEIEKQLLEKGESEIDRSLGVNPELAEYYFSSWDRMNKIFAYVKEKGEDSFVDFLRQYADQYAGAYVDLGSRSYQANSSRVCGTIIDKMAQESGQVREGIKILDIASGPEMLRSHIPDGYQDNILSLDINKQHFKNTQGNAVAGSFLNLPVRDETFDYANFSLAWTYTAFKPSSGNFERVEALAEANRVLKKGGKLVINNIYSLGLKDEKLFEEMVWSLGFKVVPAYTGEVNKDTNFSSQVITLEKVEYPGLSPREIAELIGRDHYDGLKFTRRDKKLKDTRKIVEDFTLNGEVVPVNFNDADRRILDLEKEITATGQGLKTQYGSIEAIPKADIVENNFIRILVGNKYILFKKVPEATGAVVIR